MHSDGEWDFAEQKKIGEMYEELIDQHLLRLRVEPRPVSLSMQRHGVDRFIQNGTHTFTGEYKCDKRSGDTGRIFLETEVIAADGAELAGWACKSIAQVVFTYLPKESQLLWACNWHIKMKLDRWHKKYLTGWVENRQPDDKTFKARGAAVPLEEYNKVVFRRDVIA